MSNELTEILHETYTMTEKKTKLNPSNPKDFLSMIRNPGAWGVYSDALSEGINDGTDKASFKQLLENTRVRLMENSMFQFNPYEIMTPGILRKFFPKLIAKALVNVMPIDKPDVIKIFVRARFGNYTDAGNGTFPYEFPYVGEDRWTDDKVVKNEISRGPSVGLNVEATTSDKTIDVLDVAGVSRTDAISVEKDFRISAIADTTGSVAVDVVADVDGNFYKEVTLASGTDRLTGHIDYLNGTIYWESISGLIDTITYSAVISLEENKINSKIHYDTEKIRFPIILRQISGSWTIPMEQDLKALFDINLQSEFINMIGEQLAIEIDTEMIDDLINGVYASDATGRRQATFDKNPPDNYVWGRTNWYTNIQVPLSDLSAEVYNANLMDAANIIAANPADAAVLESLNDFKFQGSAVPGGQVGYGVATVNGGRWTVLTSNIVPRGKMIVKYKSDDMQRASYVYAPYVPALLSPFPIGNNPALTVMTRYAKKMIRPESIALLNIADSGTYHYYGHGNA